MESKEKKLKKPNKTMKNQNQQNFTQNLGIGFGVKKNLKLNVTPLPMIQKNNFFKHYRSKCFEKKRKCLSRTRPKSKERKLLKL